MKLNGFVGKGSGKLGASVFAISGGEQIVRQYNPQVANPNTDAQVEQRAKLKLMSQLAAALARGIAIKKQGLVSARNQFIKINIGAATYENEKASIALSSLKLTTGVQVLGNLRVKNDAPGTVTLNMDSDVSLAVDGVRYVLCKETAENQLQVVKVVLNTEAGENGTFPAEFILADGNYVFFAYGVKSISGKKDISFSNYRADGLNDLADLATSVSDLLQNYTFTATSGLKFTV